MNTRSATIMAGLLSVAGVIWWTLQPAARQQVSGGQESAAPQASATKPVRANKPGSAIPVESVAEMPVVAATAAATVGTNAFPNSMKLSRAAKMRNPAAQAQRAAAMQLAASDPHKALKEALKLQNPSERLKALLGFSSQLALNNPEMAGRELLSNVTGEEQRRALSQLSGAWSATDPDAALTWLEKNVTDADLLRAARESVYSNWAKDDPEGAARNLLESNPSTTTLAVVMSTWADSNLPDVIEWFHSDLSADQQKSLRETLILLAGMKDNDAARALVDEMPASPDKWDVLRRLAKALAQPNPELANNFAGSLPADAGRDDLLRRVQSHSSGGDLSSVASNAKPIRLTP